MKRKRSLTAPLWKSAWQSRKSKSSWSFKQRKLLWSLFLSKWFVSKRRSSSTTLKLTWRPRKKLGMQVELEESELSEYSVIFSRTTTTSIKRLWQPRETNFSKLNRGKQLVRKRRKLRKALMILRLMLMEEKKLKKKSQSASLQLRPWVSQMKSQFLYPRLRRSSVYLACNSRRNARLNLRKNSRMR